MVSTNDHQRFTTNEKVPISVTNPHNNIFMNVGTEYKREKKVISNDEQINSSLRKR